MYVKRKIFYVDLFFHIEMLLQLLNGLDVDRTLAAKGTLQKGYAANGSIRGWSNGGSRSFFSKSEVCFCCGKKIHFDEVIL